MYMMFEAMIALLSFPRLISHNPRRSCSAEQNKKCTQTFYFSSRGSQIDYSSCAGDLCMYNIRTCFLKRKESLNTERQLPGARGKTRIQLYRFISILHTVQSHVKAPPPHTHTHTHTPHPRL